MPDADEAYVLTPGRAGAQLLVVDAPCLGVPAGLHRPQRQMPAVVAVHHAVARIVGHPFLQESETCLALARLIEQVATDVRGVRALGIGRERAVDVALPRIELAELDLREGELGAIPPVLA